MSRESLLEEIEATLERMGIAVKEATDFLGRTGEEEPSVIEKTGAGGLLAQFYGGVEHILTRICKAGGVPLPHGPRWHTALFRMFCEPSTSGLPALFDADLEAAMRPFREFRHVFVHGYGFMLDWSKVKPGLERLKKVFALFSDSVRSYIARGEDGNHL